MAKAAWSWKDYNRQHGDQADKPGAEDVELQPEPALQPEPTVVAPPAAPEPVTADKPKRRRASPRKAAEQPLAVDPAASAPTEPVQPSVEAPVVPEPVAAEKPKRRPRKQAQPSQAAGAAPVVAEARPEPSKPTKNRRGAKRQSGGWRDDLPNPNITDKAVGARIRELRVLRGKSQQALGAAVGLTFQQVQKYERGANRIGAGRLLQFAEVLDVPVSALFDQVPRPGQEAPILPLASRRVMTAARYLDIVDEKAAKTILSLLKSMAAQQGVDFSGDDEE